jgi:hypothetical protein
VHALVFFLVVLRAQKKSKKWRENHPQDPLLWADVLTKPLQGKAFGVMRAKLIKVDYKEDEVAFEQSMARAKAAKNSVTGRITKQGPTQTLQECLGGSPNGRGL